MDFNKIQTKIDELKTLKVDHVYHFQYSKRAKIPFKVHSFHESLNYRMIDFCEATALLIEQNHIVPSMALIRALFENVSICNRVYSVIDSSVRSGKLLENFDDLIITLTFGTRDDDGIKAINIMTHLEKLDKEYEGVLKFYNSLCEFVHPNMDGVLMSYSELLEDERVTLITKTITKENPVFNWIETCFLLCMGMYLEYSLKIKDLLPVFTLLCEAEIDNK